MFMQHRECAKVCVENNFKDGKSLQKIKTSRVFAAGSVYLYVSVNPKLINSKHLSKTQWGNKELLIHEVVPAADPASLAACGWAAGHCTTTTRSLIGQDMQLKVPGGQSSPWRPPAPPPGQTAKCLTSPRDSTEWKAETIQDTDLNTEIRGLGSFHISSAAKLAKVKKNLFTRTNQF